MSEVTTVPYGLFLFWKDDEVVLQCTATVHKEQQKLCLAAEGFGNRLCFLESTSNSKVLLTILYVVLGARMFVMLPALIYYTKICIPEWTKQIYQLCNAYFIPFQNWINSSWQLFACILVLWFLFSIRSPSYQCACYFVCQNSVEYCSATVRFCNRKACLVMLIF